MEPSLTIQPSLGRFILSEKRNRQLLGIALGGLILQFVIFKLLYPFPDFFSDSYSYLFAAYAHLDISIWPIGYSKFLLAFHNLTHSDTALIGFQYFFLEGASLYFFFSFLYFYNPSRASRNILFIFLFFNPLFLYLSNYVNSDPLFAALSIWWFTQLLWIIYRPRKYQILVQAILLFLCFTVRNNAYYYPLIACIAFLLSRQSWKLKLAGIVMPFLFIIPFIIRTREAAYEMTGTRQFSLFTGWQLANNALYMRGHIEVDSMELPSKETRDLDRIARRFYAATTPEFDSYLTAYVANYFVRQPEAPLKQFFSRHYNPEEEYSSTVAWGQSSVIFGDYGSYLIKHFPLSFFKYYLLRNAKNYFLPPLEKLEVYNLGIHQVDPIAQYWFHFKSQEVSAVSKEGQGKLLYLYPLFFLFINTYFFGNLLWEMFNKMVKKKAISFNQYLLLPSSFLLINICFSILATINVFRYQFFPMIVCLSFSVLFKDLSDQKDLQRKIIPNYAR